MSNVYTKQLLTGSPNGRQIVISQTTAPGGTIHVPSVVPALMEEIWLYANNQGTNPVLLTTQWGGVVQSDSMVVVMNGTSGRVLVGDGKVLSGSGAVTAYVNAGTVFVDGYVNRVEPGIDSRILDWAYRVVRNGGPVPSASTQLALSGFVQSLSAAGIMPKMISMCMHVPDSIIAASTPLIVGPAFDPWTNNSFVSSDLNSNGLVGDGNAGGSTGTKYLNTGLIPGSSIMTSTNAGGTVYMFDDPRVIQSGYAFGVGGSAFDSQFAIVPHTGGNTTDGYIWRFDVVGQNVISISSLGAGYISINRTAANQLDLYYGSSISPHSNVGTGTTAQSGSIEPSQPVFVHAINVLAFGSITGFSNRRISFAGFHQGLLASESNAFFNAIQACRKALGGGFV